jgi:hypothetical protein
LFVDPSVTPRCFPRLEHILIHHFLKHGDGHAQHLGRFGRADGSIIHDRLHAAQIGICVHHDGSDSLFGLAGVIYAVFIFSGIFLILNIA